MTYMGMPPQPAPSSPGNLSSWYRSQLMQQEEPTLPDAPAMPNAYLNQYAQHLQSMPQRENPSWKRRLLAGLIGGAVNVSSGPYQHTNPLVGADYAEKILDTPYLRSMQDWQTKGAGLNELSDIEAKQGRYGLDTWKARLDQFQNDRTFNQGRINKEADLYAKDVDDERAAENFATTIREQGYNRDAANTRTEHQITAANERARLQRGAVQDRFDKAQKTADLGREVLVTGSNFNQYYQPSAKDWLTVHKEDWDFVDQDAVTSTGKIRIKPPEAKGRFEKDAEYEARMKRYEDMQRGIKALQNEYVRKKVKVKTRMRIDGGDAVIENDPEENQ